MEITQEEALKEEILRQGLEENRKTFRRLARERNSKLLHLNVGNSFLLLNDVELYVDSIYTYVDGDGKAVSEITVKELKKR